MKYRRLGRTGLKVSVVGLGTWQYGGEWGKTFDQSEVDQILGRAKEQGINLIDTAECYGDHLSESLIGQYIRRGGRGDWIIATKFGHQFHRNFLRTERWTPDEVMKQLDQSLTALCTDYVDLYQFHSGSDEVFDQDDLWTMLDKQVQAGKIRHLGISISKGDNLYQVEAATDRNAQAIQIVYNRLDRKPEEQVFPSCARQDLGVLARVPLASGFLSGKYKPGAEFAANDVRANRDHDATFNLLQQVEQIRRDEIPAGLNMAQWALAWCLKHPAVTCVIPGCKNIAQVDANAAATDLISDHHPQAWTSQ